MAARQQRRWRRGDGGDAPGVVSLDCLHLGVGRQLHVRWPKERGASVTPRDGEDDVVHEVLDKGAREHDAAVGVEVGVGDGGVAAPRGGEDVAGGDGGEHGSVRRVHLGVGGTRSHRGVDHRLALIVRLDLEGLEQPVGKRRLPGGVDAHREGVHLGGRVRHHSRRRDVGGGSADAAGAERLAPGDAHVAVRLLVVEEHVGGKLGLRGSLGGHLRRLHDVDCQRTRSRKRGSEARVGSGRRASGRVGGELERRRNAHSPTWLDLVSIWTESCRGEARARR